MVHQAFPSPDLFTQNSENMVMNSSSALNSMLDFLRSIVNSEAMYFTFVCCRFSQRQDALILTWFFKLLNMAIFVFFKPYFL